MNILLTIHHDLDPNAGAPGVTWQLGQEYRRLGHDVHFYSFSDLPPKLPGIVKAIVFPMFAARHIIGLMQQQPLDVIDASTGDAWIWAKIRHCTSSKNPLLVTRSHGLEHTMHVENLTEAKLGNLSLSWKYPFYHGGFRLWEVSNSLCDADLAILLNRLDLTYAVENLGVRLERAQISANGIPQEFIGLPYEPTPREPVDFIRIAQIGTYIPRKGIHYGTPALSQILLRYPQVMVSLLGTGVSEAQVHADFESKVRDRVKVIPHYNHEMLPALLQGHHIKFFPTLSEGFSLVLPEAMACGLAPITTKTPGPMEIVTDGVNGVLVQPRDSEAIVQALEELISDRDYLEQLRRNAYATAQNYSWQEIATTTLALYETAKYRKKRAI
ncbi:glycosyltransferase family 4 protein [Phormidesmis sp. 146-35]